MKDIKGLIPRQQKSPGFNPGMNAGLPREGTWKIGSRIVREIPIKRRKDPRALARGVPLKGRIKFNEPLWRHTTFRIGGKAQIWFEPRDAEDLRTFIKLLNKNNRKFFIIGAGSNLLINDKGLDTVISLSLPSFKQLESQGSYIWVGAGQRLNRLIEFARDLRLGPLEFLWGIPGTVGGAVLMNAGMRQEVQKTNNYISIGDLVHGVIVMNKNGNIKMLKKQDLKFGYRKSNLSNYIVLKVLLKLQKKNKDKIDSEIKKFWLYRNNHLDLSGYSVGCIFKNPKTEFAGRLIELCGLKRTRIGGAHISDRHANFIINDGKATANDVIKLMDLVRARVKDKFGLCLQPEIKIV